MATISAGQLLTTAEQEALAQVFRKTQGPAITSFYLALCGNAASGSLDNTWTTMAQVTEFGATGYARQVFGPTTPTVASPSVISNTAVITFGPVSGSITGTPIVWGLGTDATGAGAGTTAKLMAAFLLAVARTPISGDSLQAAASAFTCQV
jgi:hypothetical protein